MDWSEKHSDGDGEKTIEFDATKFLLEQIKDDYIKLVMEVQVIFGGRKKTDVLLSFLEREGKCMTG